MTIYRGLEELCHLIKLKVLTVTGLTIHKSENQKLKLESYSSDVLCQQPQSLKKKKTELAHLDVMSMNNLTGH